MFDYWRVSRKAVFSRFTRPTSLRAADRSIAITCSHHQRISIASKIHITEIALYSMKVCDLWQKSRVQLLIKSWSEDLIKWPSISSWLLSLSTSITWSDLSYLKAISLLNRLPIQKISCWKRLRKRNILLLNSKHFRNSHEHSSSDKYNKRSWTQSLSGKLSSIGFIWCLIVKSWPSQVCFYSLGCNQRNPCCWRKQENEWFATIGWEETYSCSGRWNRPKSKRSSQKYRSWRLLITSSWTYIRLVESTKCV